MGLLDGLVSGQWTGDPNQDQAINRGLLAFGLQLMQARGSRLGPALGQAGLLGVGSYQNEVNRQIAQKRVGLQDKLLQQQVDEQERQAKQRTAIENAAKASILSPEAQAASMPGGPTLINAETIGARSPGFDQRAFINRLYGIDPLLATSQAAALAKQNAPVISKPGEVARNPVTQQIIWQNPDATQDPSAIKEYQFAVKQGYPGTFTQWNLEQKKAGASQTSVKIDNALGGGIAKEIGPLMATSFQQAQGAVQQGQTADRIIKAIDSNKVIAGPGASFRLKGLQIGQTLGITGRDANDVLANTRSAIQGLAQSTVDARAALKGQGQVSDFEGRLLEKARSGNIDDMTAGEIRQIASLNKRLSQQLIEQHRGFVGKVRGNKDPAISGLADFFDVSAPNSVVDWKDLGGGR